MKRHESGLLLTELAVVVGVIALLSSAVVTITYRTITDTKRTDEHLSAVRHVENAGYWLLRDAQAADQLAVDNLTSPQFLVLKWTEWGYQQATVYHSATYTIENLSGGVGDLRRTHEDSAGTHEETLVARFIYYNLADPANSTSVTFQDPTLNLRIVTSFSEVRETRNHRLYLRPNFMDR